MPDMPDHLQAEIRRLLDSLEMPPPVPAEGPPPDPPVTLAEAAATLERLSPTGDGPDKMDKSAVPAFIDAARTLLTTVADLTARADADDPDPRLAYICRALEADMGLIAGVSRLLVLGIIPEMVQAVMPEKVEEATKKLALLTIAALLIGRLRAYQELGQPDPFI